MASNSIIDSVTARGRITDDDVLRMRHAYYTDASITEGEVSELFQLNDNCADHAKSWIQFFAETISNFILQQKTPDGRISETNAQWLASRIKREGKVSAAERAVLAAIKRQVHKVNPVLKPLLNLVA
jgi:hypothetical protein